MYIDFLTDEDWAELAAEAEMKKGAGSDPDQDQDVSWFYDMVEEGLFK